MRQRTTRRGDGNYSFIVAGLATLSNRVTPFLPVSQEAFRAFFARKIDPLFSSRYNPV
jgi:hypothetical protein